MSIRVRLRHQSHYAYDRPVVLGPHEIRLRPLSHCRTPVFDYSLAVSPSECFMRWQTDTLNNRLARLVVPGKVDHLQIEVEFDAELTCLNPFDFFIDHDIETYPFTYRQCSELLPYLWLSESGPRFDDFMRTVGRPVKTVDLLVELNQRVHTAIRYKPRETPGIQAGEETLLLAEGSCRDMAWLLIQALRQMGFAARCVAGYLIQLKSPEREQDSADYHAWAEVYLPGGGWIGLDPTSGMLASEGHIAVATGPAPERVAAVTGTHSEASQTLVHSLEIEPLPRFAGRGVGPPETPLAPAPHVSVNVFG